MLIYIEWKLISIYLWRNIFLNVLEGSRSCKNVHEWGPPRSQTWKVGKAGPEDQGGPSAYLHQSRRRDCWHKFMYFLSYEGGQMYNIVVESPIFVGKSKV
jgi:hypothetical protein